MDYDYLKLANTGVLQLKPYQPGKPIEELRRETGIESIVKLASNENPLGASQQAMAAAGDTIWHSTRYPDSSCHRLKQVLAEFHSIGVDRLTIGNGSDQVLALLARAFVPPNGEIIISEYAFATYAIIAHTVHGVPVTVPSRDWHHDLAAMANAITSHTHLMYLANPNNPTGTWFAENEFIRFMDEVPSRVIVVVDEAYAEYAANPTYPNTIALQQHYPNLVTTRTFSKAYGLAGLRIGYSISHPDCADCLHRIRLPFAINSPAQAAAEAAIVDQEHIQRSVDSNQAGYAQLFTAFQQLDFTILPSLANFMTIDVGQKAQPLYEALLKHGIIVRPLVPYGLPHHLRITIGTEEQNERLIHALQTIMTKEKLS